ncbi:hypothetical protein FOZ61_009507 [Perkinsus olseni]|uniref:Uncharacterized protein n=1 Tax=Perkinsus olseni TaxID=32597 RepID=A0A7J6MGQ6_PEROL|nr:hypothetical protein FOZ61_009507 [Perkinsus olseni]
MLPPLIAAGEAEEGLDDEGNSRSPPVALPPTPPSDRPASEGTREHRKAPIAERARNGAKPNQTSGGPLNSVQDSGARITMLNRTVVKLREKLKRKALEVEKLRKGRRQKSSTCSDTEGSMQQPTRELEVIKGYAERTRKLEENLQLSRLEIERLQEEADRRHQDKATASGGPPPSRLLTELDMSSYLADGIFAADDDKAAEELRSQLEESERARQRLTCELKTLRILHEKANEQLEDTTIAREREIINLSASVKQLQARLNTERERACELERDVGLAPEREELLRGEIGELKRSIHKVTSRLEESRAAHRQLLAYNNTRELVTKALLLVYVESMARTTRTACRVDVLEKAHKEEKEKLVSQHEVTLMEVEARHQKELDKFNSDRYSRTAPDSAWERVGGAEGGVQILSRHLAYYRELDEIHRGRRDFNGLFITVLRNDQYSPAWFVNYIAVILGIQQAQRIRIVNEERGHHIRSCDTCDDQYAGPDTELEDGDGRVRVTVEIIEDSSDADDSTKMEAKSKIALPRRLASLWLRSHASDSDTNSGENLLSELGVEQFALLHGSQTIVREESYSQANFVGRSVCDISARRMVVTAHYVVLEPDAEAVVRLVATDVETRRVFVLYLRPSELPGGMGKLEDTTPDDISALAQSTLRIIKIDGAATLCAVEVFDTSMSTQQRDGDNRGEVGSLPQSSLHERHDILGTREQREGEIFRDSLVLDENLEVVVRIDRDQTINTISVVLERDGGVFMRARTLTKIDREVGSLSDPPPGESTLSHDGVLTHCQTCSWQEGVLTILLESTDREAMLHLFFNRYDAPSGSRTVHRRLLIHGEDGSCVLVPLMPSSSRLLNPHQSSRITAVLQERYFKGSASSFGMRKDRHGHTAAETIDQEAGDIFANSRPARTQLMETRRAISCGGSQATHDCALYAVLKDPAPGHPPIPDEYTVEVQPVPATLGLDLDSDTNSLARLELYLSCEEVEEFMKGMVGDTGLLEEENIPACILSGLVLSLDDDGVPQMTLSSTLQPCDGTANDETPMPSSLGWNELFCGTKQLNDLRLLVSVYATNTSDRTGSILVFIDEPLSHSSFFAVMPIDGQTDQPERHMISVFNFPSSSRDASREDKTFKERSLVVCLAEASFPHVITVSLVDTQVPNELSLAFRNDFCPASSRGVPNWGIVQRDEQARDGSSIAQQQRHYTRKTERSLIRHLFDTSCRMLRDGCIVEADDKSISYRYCPKGFDHTSIRQDGSAETAIPVVAATIPSNDEVEVLYAANRSVPGAEASRDLRILLKSIPLSLEDGIPTSRKLTLTFSLDDLSSTHLIVPSHDGRPFIFTTLVTLGAHTFVLSILQDSDVRIALGHPDGQRTLWQGAVMFSAEDVKLANFRAPYPSPNEHRASMLHWFTSSSYYVAPVSGTGTGGALSEENTPGDPGNLTKSQNKEFGELFLLYGIAMDPLGRESIVFRPRLLQAELIRRKPSASERENAASGIATEGPLAQTVHAMKNLQGGSAPRVDVSGEALASARREVRLADGRSCSVMVELFEGCSDRSIQAFHAINYTIRVRELNPADGRSIRTILVRDIHESDLTDWLSAYSQEDLLSVVNAPLLEAAIVTRFSFDVESKIPTDKKLPRVFFDGPPLGDS